MQKEKQSTRHLFGRELFVFQPGAQEGHRLEPREPVGESAGETARREKGGGGEEGEEGGEEESQGVSISTSMRHPIPRTVTQPGRNRRSGKPNTARVGAGPALSPLPRSVGQEGPPLFPPFLPPSCLSCSLAIQSIIHDQIFASFPHPFLPPSLTPTRSSSSLLLHALGALRP